MITQANTPILSPSYIFKDTNGGPIEIKTKYIQILSSDTNRSVIAAVTGKRLRILSITGYSQDAAAVGYVLLKDGSGGTSLVLLKLDPAAPANPMLILDLDALGWLDTSAGVGLFADGAGQNCILNLRYIEYTQAT